MTWACHEKAKAGVYATDAWVEVVRANRDDLSRLGERENDRSGGARVTCLCTAARD
jgi:hypothetical protein